MKNTLTDAIQAAKSLDEHRDAVYKLLASEYAHAVASNPNSAFANKVFGLIQSLKHFYIYPTYGSFFIRLCEDAYTLLYGEKIV